MKPKESGVPIHLEDVELFHWISEDVDLPEEPAETSGDRLHSRINFVIVKFKDRRKKSAEAEILPACSLLDFLQTLLPC